MDLGCKPPVLTHVRVTNRFTTSSARPRECTIFVHGTPMTMCLDLLSQLGCDPVILKMLFRSRHLLRLSGLRRRPHRQMEGDLCCGHLHDHAAKSRRCDSSQWMRCSVAGKYLTLRSHLVWPSEMPLDVQSPHDRFISQECFRLWALMRAMGLSASHS